MWRNHVKKAWVVLVNLVIVAFLSGVVVLGPLQPAVSAQSAATLATLMPNADKLNFKYGGGLYSVYSDSCSGSSETATLSGSLPDKTVKMLDAADIKSKLKDMKDIYLYGEKETGVPWLVLAAIHYREGNMRPGTSVFNGQPLGDYKNVDGIMLSSDAKVDVVNAANHLIKGAKSVYGVDVTKSQTAEALGQAFLSYNRGSMYKNWNKTWQDSPYVMNYFDESHMAMKWTDADSYVKPGGRQVNSVSGSTDSRPGALAVYKYLSDSSDVQASANATSSGTCEGGSDGSATIVGDVAFPLITNKKNMDKYNKGLFKNGTTGRAGHPYIAYDILTPARTKVAAFMNGTVLRTNSGNRCKSPGTTITIYNQENKLTITYIHVFKTTYVKSGDTVTAGQVIAEVGTADYGCGVEHLHIDANASKGRPVCSRLGCADKALFRDIGPELYKTYEALPES